MSQVAVSSECCSTSDHCDSEVRAWSVTANAWWPALADCSSEAAVQARCDGPSLPSAPSSKLSRRRRLRFQSSRSPASSICQASSTVCPTCSPKHVWKPYFFCCRTNSLEFTVRLLAVDSEHFRRDVKTHLFSGHYEVLAHYGCFYVSHSKNWHLFIYLLDRSRDSMTSSFIKTQWNPVIFTEVISSYSKHPVCAVDVRSELVE